MLKTGVSRIIPQILQTQHTKLNAQDHNLIREERPMSRKRIKKQIFRSSSESMDLPALAHIELGDLETIDLPEIKPLELPFEPQPFDWSGCLLDEWTPLKIELPDLGLDLDEIFQQSKQLLGIQLQKQEE